MSTRAGWSVLIRCGLVMLALIVAACGGGSSPSRPDAGGSPDAPPGPALTRLEVTPLNASLPAGLTQQLVAIGVYSDSTTKDVTAQVTWRSGREQTATVSASGVVTAVATGTVAITAQQGTVTAAVSLTVTDAQLVSLAVTPLEPSLPKGLTRQLTATATFTDRSTRDVTRDVTWASSAPQFVRISNTAGTQGLATAVAVGAASISARLSGKTGEVSLQVTDAALVLVEVVPLTTSVPKGLSQLFDATAVFTDQSRIDVTRDVQWTSSAPDVVTISNEVGSQGKATAAGLGTASISATLQGKTGSATIEVTAAILLDLDITPGFSQAPKGVTRQLTATGTFSDSSMRDVSEEVLWESSAPGIVSISNVPGSRGRAKAESVGSATITASRGTFPFAQANLQVTAAEMTAIVLDPINPVVPRGPLLQQFTATAIFTDGFMPDVTTVADWTSSNATVAQVSNTNPFEGRTTVGEPGTATISATIGALSGSTTITVTTATLVSVAVVPSQLRCFRNGVAQLRAIGTFSDQSTRDVTEDMTWASSSFGVASVRTDIGRRGETTCVAGGDAIISATRGGIRGECAVYVSIFGITQLTIDPHAPSVAAGGTLQLGATARFPDPRNVTASVTWSSSNPAVAQISNEQNEWGRVTAVAPGTVTLRAEYDGLTATTTLTVQ